MGPRSCDDPQAWSRCAEPRPSARSRCLAVIRRRDISVALLAEGRARRPQRDRRLSRACSSVRRADRVWHARDDVESRLVFARSAVSGRLPTGRLPSVISAACRDRTGRCSSRARTSRIPTPMRCSVALPSFRTARSRRSDGELCGAGRRRWSTFRFATTYFCCRVSAAGAGVSDARSDLVARRRAAAQDPAPLRAALRRSAGTRRHALSCRPHYAHDGVAVDAAHILDRVSRGVARGDRRGVSSIFCATSSPRRDATPTPTSVPPARRRGSIRRCAARAATPSRVRWDERTVARFLGYISSEPKPTVRFDSARGAAPPGGVRGADCERRTRNSTARHKFLSMTFWFYVNGEAIVVESAGVAALRILANRGIAGAESARR